MARCNNDALLRKISIKPIDKSLTEVDLMLYGTLPDCRRIDTRHYTQIGTGSITYDKYKKPKNRYECLRTVCVNTGTLTVPSTDKVYFFMAENATEWSSGIITFYAVASSATTVTVEISDSNTFTNADQYTYSVPATMQDDGFYPVVIDLSQVPTDIGTGWTPSEAGAYIRIYGSNAIGISTIGVYDSIADFELNDVVKLGCLTSVGGTYDISALERACASAMYDTSSVTSFSQTLTARKVSGNYWKLNPLNAKGEAAEGFEMVTKDFTIASATVSGKTYGKVTIGDFYEDECGGVAIQMLEDCSVIDSAMRQVSLPIIVDLEANQFQVFPNETSGVDIFFDGSLVGQKAAISYPKAVNVEEVVGNAMNLNNVRARMSYPIIVEDGPERTVKEVHVFDHVLVTSFPATISESDTEFSFTVQIFADADGNFYKIRRIVD